MQTRRKAGPRPFPAGVFGFPTTTLASLAAAFGFSVAVATAVSLLTLLGTHLAVRR